MASKKRRLCPSGGKVCYTTKKKALKVIKRSEEKKWRFDLPKCLKRVYKCPNCGYWHTTKMEQHDKVANG